MTIVVPVRLAGLFEHGGTPGESAFRHDANGCSRPKADLSLLPLVTKLRILLGADHDNRARAG